MFLHSFSIVSFKFSQLPKKSYFSRAEYVSTKIKLSTPKNAEQKFLIKLFVLE